MSKVLVIMDIKDANTGNGKMVHFVPQRNDDGVIIADDKNGTWFPTAIVEAIDMKVGDKIQKTWD